MRAVLPPEQENALKLAFFEGLQGFFVEVGANDPVAGSQTWQLEQIGWSGVLVEPLPDLVEKLRSTRRAQVFECACSSPANAGRNMPLYVSGPLSSLSPTLMDAGTRPETSISVATRTLNDILAQASAPTPIDFLSIDVEGHEVDVLQGFDFDRWSPRLIMIEDHARSLSKHRLLVAHGYKLLQRTGLNNWYVPQASPRRPSLFGRLQLLRKMYLGLPFRHLRHRLQSQQRLQPSATRSLAE